MIGVDVPQQKLSNCIFCTFHQALRTWVFKFNTRYVIQEQGSNAPKTQLGRYNKKWKLRVPNKAGLVGQAGQIEIFGNHDSDNMDKKAGPIDHSPAEQVNNMARLHPAPGADSEVWFFTTNSLRVLYNEHNNYNSLRNKFAGHSDRPQDEDKKDRPQDKDQKDRLQDNDRSEGQAKG
eukprot:1160459-Pelagomonas_calceolata.AAC.9